MKIVKFRWKDAYTASGWYNEEEKKKLIEDYDLWMWTVGILLKKTKRELIVCTSWQPENKTHGTENKFAAIHKIPMTWIRNYKVIGEVGK